MHEFIQRFLGIFIDTMQHSGLWGVMLLMAMERSIFPVPSEFVVPPAAYLAHTQPHFATPWLDVVLVVLAGTLGSCIGAGVTYWAARGIGRPLILRYGKYMLLPEKKLHKADAWMVRYGAAGIFIAALLPVIRHLISIPAAIVGMRFRTFMLMTLLGSFLWCTILAVFGVVMVNDMRVVVTQGDIANPVQRQAFEAAFTRLTWATVALVSVAYAIYHVLAHRTPQAVPPHEEANSIG